LEHQQAGQKEDAQIARKRPEIHKKAVMKEKGGRGDEDESGERRRASQRDTERAYTPLRAHTRERAHRKPLSEDAEMQIDALLHAENIQRRAVYRPGEVCRLLRISPTTLRQLCELAEQPDSSCKPPQSLESFKIGCHRRIEHDALVKWLTRNQSMEREG
jgi:hypothetical protein